MENRLSQPAAAKKAAATKRAQVRSVAAKSRGSVAVRTVAVRKPDARVGLSRLISGLKSLSERSGEAVGETYARVAGSFLQRVEWLEDLNAERRARQRAQARSAITAGASDQTARLIDSPKTAK